MIRRESGLKPKVGATPKEERRMKKQTRRERMREARKLVVQALGALEADDPCYTLLVECYVSLWEKDFNVSEWLKTQR